MSQYKEQFKPIKFPEDEQKHDHIIEWWYFNGNLQTADGRSFSYMDTLFATKPKLVKIPFLSKVPLKTLYFSHYLLSDNNNHKFWHKVNPICLVDPNSFTKPLLWAHYDNACLIEETEPFSYHVVNDFVDLKMSSSKMPLLVNQKGFLDLNVKTTYYYSLTHLLTEGLIKVNGEWLSVKGLSWMDHQWAQTPLTKDDKWLWLSMQLDNGLDLVCFVYGDEIKTYHASLIDQQNQIKTTDKVIFNNLPVKYKSPESGAVYQLGYQIELPEWNLELEVKPYNKNQEMVFGTLNYWEGGIEISGQANKQKVSGQGFLELVISPMRKSLTKIYLQKLRKGGVKSNLKLMSDNFWDKFKAYK